MRPDIKTAISGESSQEVEGGVDETALRVISSRYGIDRLGLSNRSRNALAREGVQTIRDVVDINRRGLVVYLNGIGDKSAGEITDAVWSYPKNQLGDMAKLYTQRSAQRIRKMGGPLIPDNTPVDVRHWSSPYSRVFPGWENLYHSLSTADWVSLLGALAMVSPGYKSTLQLFGDLRDPSAAIGACTVSEIRDQRLYFLQQALT